MSTLQIKTGSITSTGFETTFTDIHDSPKWDAYIKITADLKLTVTLKNTKGNDSTYYNGIVGVRLNGISESDSVASGSWSFSGTGYTKELCTNLQLKKFPNNLYLYCSECTDSNYIYGDIQFTDARHSKNKPEPPVIVSSTGTTITVKPGKASSDCVSGTYEFKNVNAETWHDKQTTLGGSGVYGKGTEHTYKARQQCVCKNEYLYSDTVTGKTWDINGSLVSTTTNSLTFTVTQIAGNGKDDDASSEKIRYKLYYDSGCTNGATSATDCTVGETKKITIDNLKSNTTYWLKAWTSGMHDTNGDVDNYVILKGKTDKIPFVLNSIACDTSATTMRIKANVTDNDSTGIKILYIIRDARTGNNINTSSAINVSEYYVVTGLAKGVEYNIIYECKDSDNYVVSDNRTYATTKNLAFSNTAATTKNIKVDLNSTGGAITCWIIDPQSSTFSPTSTNGNTFYFSNLYMAKTYNIYAELNGCYKYDSHGVPTATNDSRINISKTTCELLVSLSSSSSKQYSITSAYQLYMKNGSNSVPTGVDAIDNSHYKCTSITIKPTNGSRKDILDADLANETSITNLPIVNTDGTCSTTINNLKYSYCEYQITAVFTDGGAQNSIAIVIHITTTYPYVYIYSNKDNKYHKAIPYIYDGNKYRISIAHVYDNNKYKEMNGEN